MYISSLSLANFRNYTSEKIEFSPYTNVIYGDNAQGKTNILEAVYIFSQGRSHRAKSDKELIKFGEDFSRLSLDFHDSERDYTAAMQLMKNGRKNIKINHVQICLLYTSSEYVFFFENTVICKNFKSSDRYFVHFPLLLSAVYYCLGHKYRTFVFKYIVYPYKSATFHNSYNRCCNSSLNSLI